jgi:hypothetical protein
MAKRKTATEREFSGSGKRSGPFTLKSTLTDDECIAALGGIDKPETFEGKCAFEVHKQANGFGGRENMIAWAFRMAENIVNPPPGVMLSETVRGMVAFRRPLKGEVDGEAFKVSLCGPNSKHMGSYSITDGEAFGSNRFYGYAEPDGMWRPTQKTPESVVKKLTS